MKQIRVPFKMISVLALLALTRRLRHNDRHAGHREHAGGLRL